MPINGIYFFFSIRRSLFAPVEFWCLRESVIVVFGHYGPFIKLEAIKWSTRTFLFWRTVNKRRAHCSTICEERWGQPLEFHPDFIYLYISFFHLGVFSVQLQFSFSTESFGRNARQVRSWWDNGVVNILRFASFFCYFLDVHVMTCDTRYSGGMRSADEGEQTKKADQKSLSLAIFIGVARQQQTVTLLLYVSLASSSGTNLMCVFLSLTSATLFFPFSVLWHLQSYSCRFDSVDDDKEEEMKLNYRERHCCFFCSSKKQHMKAFGPMSFFSLSCSLVCPISSRRSSSFYSSSSPFCGFDSRANIFLLFPFCSLLTSFLVPQRIVIFSQFFACFSDTHSER